MSPRRDTGQRRKPSHLLGLCAVARSAGRAVSTAPGSARASVTVGGYPARLPHETRPGRAVGCATVELTGDERNLLLAALFELSIHHADDVERVAQIEALARRLGGDPDTALFGAYRHEASESGQPVPDYPTDETDEG